MRRHGYTSGVILLLCFVMLTAACNSTASTPVASQLGTQLPQSLSSISATNAQQLRRLAAWETGDIVRWTLTFSPDSQLLAAGLESQQAIVIFDVQNARVLRRLEGPQDRVTRVVFSPDGILFAASAWDKIVRVWNVSNWQQIQAFPQPDIPQSLSFSPDGKVLAIGIQNGTIRLWDVGSEHELRTLIADSTLIRDLSFSPDGSRLASVAGKNIRLWDTTSWQEIRTLSSHSGTVWTATFSSDGKTLLSSSDDGTVRVWDTANGQELRKLTEKGIVEWYGARFSPDGQIIAATSRFNLLVWDTASGNKLALLSNSVDDVIEILTIAPDGRLLATGGQNSVQLFGIP